MPNFQATCNFSLTGLLCRNVTYVKFSDLTKFNLNVAEMTISVFERAENIV